MTTPPDELAGEDPSDLPDEPGAETIVTAHRSTPDRTVFTEDGNSDGWIATDLTVEPWR